jgi:hypothetical protein
MTTHRRACKCKHTLDIERIVTVCFAAILHRRILPLLITHLVRRPCHFAPNEALYSPLSQLRYALFINHANNNHYEPVVRLQRLQYRCVCTRSYI